jgi:hypothetical protein
MREDATADRARGRIRHALRARERSSRVTERPKKCRGRNIRLSLARRLVVDYMWASSDVPTVSVSRRIAIPKVIAARQRHPDRPAWPTVFAKAIALVANEIPELRRSYIKLPWPHLHEYADNTVSILHEREIDGDTAVIPIRIRNPETYAVTELSRMLRQAAEAPIERSKFVSGVVAVSRLPVFLRRPIWWLFLNVPRMRRHTMGTFGVSSVAPLQAELGQARTPISCFFTYGPMDADGSLAVRLNFDHRVFDGGVAARALSRLEQVLNTTMLAELETPRASPAARRGSARGRRPRRAS